MLLEITIPARNDSPSPHKPNSLQLTPPVDRKATKLVTFPENSEQNDQKMRGYQEAISPSLFGFGLGLRDQFNIPGTIMFLEASGFRHENSDCSLSNERHPAMGNPGIIKNHYIVLLPIVIENPRG